ncbi:VOC family protein [Roseomonas sp. JC162]|uniref:VOC family protein n=1 Tax=Neoroseomonas marina TaxID=1232220 RepID=A0A848E8Y3_9PROT|nr:VOC family protein [Neoroseomonas marina]NMJ40622.1 VOC family protein [Neoroseomonas marina]
MLDYVTIGANDLIRSGQFYTAILVPLGYERNQTAEGIEFTLRHASGPVSGAVYVKRPFDGQKATAGNGSMNAFRAATQAMVRDLHAAGLEAGGSDEGGPGFRAEYSDHFYVGYLRDPVGNKIAIFCSNPAEGRRDGGSSSRGAG